jgi:hypothetical protein
MGAPLAASPPITPFAKLVAFLQLANKNGDKKRLEEETCRRTMCLHWQAGRPV